MFSAWHIRCHASVVRRIDPMIMRIGRFAVAALASAATSLLAQPAYDPARDGKADLSAVLANARVVDRPVLVVVGGDWCPTCLQLDRAMSAHAGVQSILTTKALSLKINYDSKNKNKGAMDMLPFFVGYPAMFLLRSNGERLDFPSVTKFYRNGQFDMNALQIALNLSISALR